jgi:hypothetical protein
MAGDSQVDLFIGFDEADPVWAERIARELIPW